MAAIVQSQGVDLDAAVAQLWELGWKPILTFIDGTWEARIVRRAGKPASGYRTAQPGFFFRASTQGEGVGKCLRKAIELGK